MFACQTHVVPNVCCWARESAELPSKNQLNQTNYSHSFIWCMYLPVLFTFNTDFIWFCIICFCFLLFLFVLQTYTFWMFCVCMCFCWYFLFAISTMWFLSICRMTFQIECFSFSLSLFLDHPFRISKSCLLLHLSLISTRNFTFLATALLDWNHTHTHIHAHTRTHFYPLYFQEFPITKWIWTWRKEKKIAAVVLSFRSQVYLMEVWLKYWPLFNDLKVLEIVRHAVGN